MTRTPIQLICEVASIPSFSSYEERLHPLIRRYVEQVPGATIEVVPNTNLLITVPGNPSLPTVAIASHLDKINHFETDSLNPISIELIDGKLKGLLDDATGVGICLHFLLRSKQGGLPPLLILLSEMEESTGLKKTPHLVKNNGEGYSHGMGARALAKHLSDTNRVPAAIVTIDTTPLFKGTSGVALYSRSWDLMEYEPSAKLVEHTEEIESWFTTNFPKVLLRNNTNDYLEYGKALNESGGAIPSFAIEPSIFPYHCADEEVFIEDVESIVTIVESILQPNSPLFR
jgi:hypothetical protein